MDRLVAFLGTIVGLALIIVLAALLAGLVIRGGHSIATWSHDASRVVDATASEPPTERSPAAPSASLADHHPGSSSCEVSWGPAGPAPQTATAAAALLGVDAGQLSPETRGSCSIGWVIGDQENVTTGTSLSVRLPAGTCIDWSPNAANLSGTLMWSTTFAADWERSLLASDATFDGPKATVFWTPCNKYR